VRAPGFTTSFSDLPATLPVFPLAGVLLLPGGQLPLNVFEPRYLAMLDDALASNRMIGMVQPTAEPQQAVDQAGVPALYPTGCAGRIVQFAEAEGNRYLITLAGVVRFDIVQEITSMRGYRRMVPDWTAYRGDVEATGEAAIDRDRLLTALRGYFTHNGIKADWDVIQRTDDVRLVTMLAMICPFDASEKQALLVAREIDERAEAMIALMEMAIHPTSGTDNARH
jgi:Lon protease-like protein